MQSSKMKEYARAALFLTLMLGGLSTAAALPVVPGLQGFGVDTPAGRGGKVYKVTNLKESGEGSLAACVNRSGPRVCVFEVGGIITLTSDLNINDPYITIAGQTAPSPGITIRGASLGVYTHDVLVQHIRMRPGDDPEGSDPGNRDGVIVSREGTDNVVFDHLSITWTTDELISVWKDVGDVTFANTMFAEPLDESIHQKGKHGYGPLVIHTARVAMVNNLLAHSRERNARSAASEFVFANNVVYNWRNRGTELFGRDGIVSKSSIIGNVYKPGEDTRGSAIILQPNPDSSLDMIRGSKVYVEDNRAPGYKANDPWAVVNNRAGSWVKASSPPTSIPDFSPMKSHRVEDYVLANVGARPGERDFHDARIIETVAEGTGKIIDSPSDVGGWKNTGMTRRSLSIPSNPDGDDNGDGYTNLEEWLHSFSESVEGTIAPPSAPENLRIE